MSSMLFFDANTNSAFESTYTASGRPWVAGSTLSYLKRAWERNNFRTFRLGRIGILYGAAGMAEFLTLPMPSCALQRSIRRTSAPNRRQARFGGRNHSSDFDK